MRYSSKTLIVFGSVLTFEGFLYRLHSALFPLKHKRSSRSDVFGSPVLSAVTFFQKRYSSSSPKDSTSSAHIFEKRVGQSWLKFFEHFEKQILVVPCCSNFSTNIPSLISRTSQSPFIQN